MTKSYYNLIYAHGPYTAVTTQMCKYDFLSPRSVCSPVTRSALQPVPHGLLGKADWVHSPVSAEAGRLSASVYGAPTYSVLFAAGAEKSSAPAEARRTLRAEGEENQKSTQIRREM